MSADRLTGKPVLDAGGRQPDLHIPSWLINSSQISIGLIPLLVSPEPQGSSTHCKLTHDSRSTRTGKARSAITHAVVETILKGDKYNREVAIASQFLIGAELTAMRADFYMKFLQVLPSLHVQFHQETARVLLNCLSRIRDVDFTGAVVSRQALVDMITHHLNYQVPEIRQAAALAAGRVVPRRRARYDDVSKDSLEALASKLREIASSSTSPKSLSPPLTIAW